MLENEIWIDVENYDGFYQVSNFGRVKSLKGKKQRILQPVLSHSGYLKVHLSKNNIIKQCQVHRLVCDAFLSNLNNYPQVNHLDRNKLNNNLLNLEWVSASENNIHAYSGVHNKKVKVAQLDKNTGEVIRGVDSIAELSKFGVNVLHVGEVCLGKRKTCGGFKFKYI